MVAHGAEQGITPVLAHEVEVRARLEIDEIARVDDVIDIVPRPFKRFGKGLLLARTESLRAPSGGGDLVGVFVGIGVRKMRIGYVQH